MTPSPALGVLIIIISGLWIGGGGWPIKLMRNYAYEHIGLITSLLSLIVGPWAITLLSCPHAMDAYRSLDPSILIKANLFSLAWGIANVLCLICYLRIGFSLTGGILVGVAIPLGVTVPMVFKGSGLFSNAPNLLSPAGLTVLSGAAVMLVGVVFIVLSGIGRDRAFNKATTVSREIGIGLLMAVLAGLLSVGNSFSFVYSQGPIVAAMKARGAGDIAANFAVWSVALFAGGLVNVLVPLWFLFKKRSWGIFLAHPLDLLLCIFCGLQGCVVFAIMGRGMLYLGVLGASVGYGVSQAMQMVGGQLVGFAWGEWKGITGVPRIQILWGVFILIVAVVILAAGNSMAASGQPGVHA
jgi:hypothetical protein